MEVLDPALVRVTVASASRRVDLALPGSVPVAELTPELARSVGLLDAATVHLGCRLVSGGRVLAPDAGLRVQGVLDGAVLTVTGDVPVPPPRVYDDLAEAMADAVEQEVAPWSPQHGRRAALSAAGVLSGAGAVALLAQPPSAPAATAASLVAVVLAAAAIGLSRRGGGAGAAVAVAWMSAGYAAVAGLSLPGYDGQFGSLLAPGGAVLLIGLALVLGLRQERPLLLAPVVLGAATAVASVTAGRWGGDPGVFLTCAMTLLVLAGDGHPWLALGATRTGVDPLLSVDDITAPPGAIDVHQVREDARTAHEILAGMSATVGALIVVVAPVAVLRGWAGTLVAVQCCLLVMLRTRRHRSATLVLLGLASGVLGLASTAAAVVWVHPAWRPAAALASVAAAATVLVMTLLQPRSVLRARLGDLVENLALLSLLPLLVVVTGLYAAAGAWP